MASKKYTLLAPLLFAAVTAGFAQLGGVIDYKDSSKVPASRMAQQNEWRNNSKTQTFPAKPRNMWQVGAYVGTWVIDGDCPSVPGWNVGLQVRKALGYVISLRGQVGFGQTTGLDYRKNGNTGNNEVLRVYNVPGSPNSTPSSRGPGWYIHNYRTTAITPSVDALISLNNLMFHRKQSKFNIYALVGYTAFIYQTKMDVLNGASPYNYQALTTNPSYFNRSRKDIRKDLRDNLFDGSYETQATVNDRRQNFDNSASDQYQIRHSLDLGAGAEFRIGSRYSVGLEVKWVRTDDDYLDGWFLQRNNAALTSEHDNAIFANASFNVNLGSPAKRVAPLWWLNPLGYAYGELSNPSIMKFPKPVLDDTDNDGVTDQFDIEPNTPAGCPVDAKGKSRDTDGDGVPDCRDKELITPTTCQPVNADGVGSCPDPACCKVIPPVVTASCNIGSLPSAQFASGSVKVGKDAEAILSSAASTIKANPLCKICVVGHGGASKREQQLSWDRVNAVINYMVEKQGISRDRFVFKYGEEGDGNTVDLQDCSSEEGPNTVPAPHPQYRKN
jgi:outer membrane protein OmpA-like peptidoglycan-associated protein